MRCVFCDQPAIPDDDVCEAHYQDVKRSRIARAITDWNEDFDPQRLDPMFATLERTP
jgi:hypothetical protein